MLTNETTLAKRPNNIESTLNSVNLKNNHFRANLSQNLTFHFYDETSWNVEWCLGFFFLQYATNRLLYLILFFVVYPYFVYISAHFQRSQRWYMMWYVVFSSIIVDSCYSFFYYYYLFIFNTFTDRQFLHRYN